MADPDMWPPSYFWIYPQGGTVAYYRVEWVKTFCIYLCMWNIKSSESFWLILTADPDGLMVVINTCDPHLVSGSSPRVAQLVIMEWNGCKHFVYFCVCEILKVQSHFWLILTADPDGLMVEISTYDPHIVSGSTPRGGPPYCLKAR